ncbi:MAG: glycogen debranching protein GlgX, partial [Woeseiaceae bacterium]|nr:glycogen debranching protein GlgX [Woeseiaceae bacterium]
DTGAASAGPRIPWAETIFYETNVRGFTMRHPQVDLADRGRFAGMRNTQVLEYLKSLGITSVELMPVHAFIDEHHLAKRGLRNFWGYNSINFFAPANRYAGHDPVGEFRDMVNHIHDAGLEVILDVAYNHTAEADGNGPTLSFRGLDNHAYYRLDPDDASVYVNDTGCGNTLNADSGVVQQLVIDSLRYWAVDMGVDGFRFDLGSVLGRHANGFSSDHPLLLAIAKDVVLGDRKLVAEPWDPGPGGYQLGRFPPGWAEWNDRSRDAMRAYWRGDDDTVGELARRIHGSSDLFEHNGRGPFASVDFVTCHDGFTLLDLVSYERRHNEANGENNRDGHAHNLSCNYGVEGPSDDPEVVAKRRQHRLNLLATLLFSQGTPMLLAGDEFGNSQAGNNNAYAQDNDTGWLDWSGLQTDVSFVKSVRELVWARRNSDLFRIDAHVHGHYESQAGVIRNTWINPDGSERQGDDWNDGQPFGFLIARDDGDAILLLINGGPDEREFVLPGDTPAWRVDASTGGGRDAVFRDRLGLAARTVMLLSALPG